MALLLVDTRREPEPAPSTWEPNWRMWSWIALALAFGLAASQVNGGIGLVCVLVAFGAACKAIDVAMPYRAGLREWRQ